MLFRFWVFPDCTFLDISRQGALALIDCGGLLCVLTMSMAYLVSGSYNPFLYFRF